MRASGVYKAFTSSRRERSNRHGSERARARKEKGRGRGGEGASLLSWIEERRGECIESETREGAGRERSEERESLSTASLSLPLYLCVSTCNLRSLSLLLLPLSLMRALRGRMYLRDTCFVSL